MTLVNPSLIADAHTSGDWPWSWCMTIGICG
jgi:hypothetical protein